MQALLSDGPLEGRKVGVDTDDEPPVEIEVDIEDGSVYTYVFDREDDDAGVLVYTFKDSYEH
jgi:hypothetical protein